MSTDPWAPPADAPPVPVTGDEPSCYAFRVDVGAARRVWEAYLWQTDPLASVRVRHPAAVVAVSGATLALLGTAGVVGPTGIPAGLGLLFTGALPWLRPRMAANADLSPNIDGVEVRCEVVGGEVRVDQGNGSVRFRIAAFQAPVVVPGGVVFPLPDGTALLTTEGGALSGSLAGLLRAIHDGRGRPTSAPTGPEVAFVGPSFAETALRLFRETLLLRPFRSWLLVGSALVGIVGISAWLHGADRLHAVPLAVAAMFLFGPSLWVLMRLMGMRTAVTYRARHAYRWTAGEDGLWVTTPEAAMQRPWELVRGAAVEGGRLRVTLRTGPWEVETKRLVSGDVAAFVAAISANARAPEEPPVEDAQGAASSQGAGEA